MLGLGCLKVGSCLRHLVPASLFILPGSHHNQTGLNSSQGRDTLMLIDWDDTIFCTTAVCDDNATPKAESYFVPDQVVL